ncbi:MAG TPA: branched-chain amino acid ABC transporter permease, partial [Usitatibacter sp.]|nr:branched-chain amino acid ABC transporter permease [Usitatibacter sp.]
ITGYRLLVVALVAVAVIGLFLLLRRTPLGIRIRAGTLDLETVSALGVNIYMLRALNFALGCLLAGLAGVLAAGVLGLTPPMGNSLIMPSFVAIIVGGVGSLVGAILGGLLIGLAAGITTTFYPAASEAVIYLIMLIVLVVRPRGLLGHEGLFE